MFEKILEYLAGCLDLEYAPITALVNFLTITVGEKLLYGNFSLYHVGEGFLLPFGTSLGLYGLNRLNDYMKDRKRKNLSK